MIVGRLLGRVMDLGVVLLHDLELPSDDL